MFAMEPLSSRQSATFHLWGIIIIVAGRGFSKEWNVELLLSQGGVSSLGRSHTSSHEAIGKGVLICVAVGDAVQLVVRSGNV